MVIILYWREGEGGSNGRGGEGEGVMGGEGGTERVKLIFKTVREITNVCLQFCSSEGEGSHY